jgi:glycosyltransferase involved in cell wall biosynthesis
MKALALVEAPNHVCCRYRIRAFEPALRGSGGSLTVRALARGAVERWRQLGQAGAFDTVVLQRKLLPRWQLRRLRRRARYLVFDFDDAVLYRDSYDPRGPFSKRRAARFAATVRAADAVLAGNDFLADCALRSGAKAERVQVIPTCIDMERYPPSKRIARPGPEMSTPHPGPPPQGGREAENGDPAEGPPPRRETQSSLPPCGGGPGWGASSAKPGLDLVWIGSSSTLQGLERQRSLWEQIGRSVPGVRLRVICDRFPKFESLPVVAMAWNEATEANDLAAGDVGVSWVPDDLWSQGKCGLKVLQYQAAGLPVLANPVGVQAELVRPGVTGLLARTPEEWVEAVRKLAGDPALQLRMGREARASVEAGFSVEAWAGAFVAAIAPPRSSPRSVRAPQWAIRERKPTGQVKANG